RREVRVAGDVTVLLTSDRRMRSLNRRFRRKDKPTDVLSFPSAQGGDIAISLAIARQNAKVLGHPVEDELKVLLLHGLLHLKGYDHERDNGRMARREESLRRKLRLPLSLTARANGGRS